MIPIQVGIISIPIQIAKTNNYSKRVVTENRASRGRPREDINPENDTDGRKGGQNAGGEGENGQKMFATIRRENYRRAL